MLIPAVPFRAPLTQLLTFPLVRLLDLRAVFESTFLSLDQISPEMKPSWAFYLLTQLNL